MSISKNNKKKDLIENLKRNNKKYISENKKQISKYKEIQKPKIALLTCSDSRVIPEYIFSKTLGDIFVVRVAGNVAIDNSVISSLEYAVENLKVNLIILMGHTNCGAIYVAEKCKKDDCGPIINEIKKSFSLFNNHVLSNTMYQVDKLPKRSKIIANALNERRIDIIGAIYNLEDGLVEFLWYMNSIKIQSKLWTIIYKIIRRNIVS